MEALPGLSLEGVQQHFVLAGSLEAALNPCLANELLEAEGASYDANAAHNGGAAGIQLVPGTHEPVPAQIPGEPASSCGLVQLCDLRSQTMNESGSLLSDFSCPGAKSGQAQESSEIILKASAVLSSEDLRGPEQPWQGSLLTS